MSSRTKTTGTKAEAEPPLVPKLRFPAFRGAAGWDASFLGELSEVVRGGSPRPIDGFITTSQDGLNWLKIGDVDKEVKYITNTTEKVRPEALSKTRVVNPGDLILSNSMSFGRPYILQITTCIHDGWIAITKISKKTDRDFLYYLISGPSSQSYFLDNAAGSGVLNLNADIIKAMRVCIPKAPEQQKIAECLSSVDELMAAQARKVDALKIHKKGLMQQLFPREGETQPRLRFPEFQNAGEWMEASLGELCDRIMDGTHFSPKTKGGPRPYLTSKNVKDGRIDLSNLSYISEEEHSEIYKRCPVKLRDVLLTKDGANTGNCAVNTLDFEFSLLSSVAVLRGKPLVILQNFLFQSILSDRVQTLISESMSGQAITRITLAKIGGFLIPVTSTAEQQRIADCLTTLDALITAETQKHEALKTHKKGLMQQLFPCPEAVEA